MDKTNLENLEKILYKKFKLSAEEITELIEDIVKSNDEDFVSALELLFDEFCEGQTENDKKFAKEALKNCISVYSDQSAETIYKFTELVLKAKELKIDPIKLVNKTNLKLASPKKLEKLLGALCKNSYSSLYDNDEYILFNQEKAVSLIENCSSLISSASAKNIQDILYVLESFLYDEETNNFVVSPKSIIEQVPSILKQSPKKLEEVIDFLEQNFGKNHKDLVMRVCDSASILLVNPSHLSALKNSLTDSLEYLEKTPTEAQDLISNFLSIDSLTTLTKLNNFDFVAKNAEILKNYLGAENASLCLLNDSVLSLDSDILNNYLYKLCQEEAKSNLNLREFFIKHTYSCLNALKNGESVAKNSKPKKSTKTDKDVSAMDDAKKTIENNSLVPITIKDGAEVDELIGITIESFLRHQKEKTGKKRAGSKKDGNNDSGKIIATKNEQRNKEDKLLSELHLVDKIFDELDDLDFVGKFDEIVTRLAKFIDAKLGNGTANKRFHTDEVVEIYKKYMSVCQRDFLKLFVGPQTCQDLAKLKSMSPDECIKNQKDTQTYMKAIYINLYDKMNKTNILLDTAKTCQNALEDIIDKINPSQKAKRSQRQDNDVAQFTDLYINMPYMQIYYIDALKKATNKLYSIEPEYILPGATYKEFLQDEIPAKNLLAIRMRLEGFCSEFLDIRASLLSKFAEYGIPTRVGGKEIKPVALSVTEPNPIMILCASNLLDGIISIEKQKTDLNEVVNKYRIFDDNIEFLVDGPVMAVRINGEDYYIEFDKNNCPIPKLDNSCGDDLKRISKPLNFEAVKQFTDTHPTSSNSNIKVYGPNFEEHK